MAKLKTYFVCQTCGSKSPRWLGKCTVCNEWNTFMEETATLEENDHGRTLIKSKTTTPGKPIALNQIDGSKSNRFASKIAEFDRVLGGGIIPGSSILIGGDPGIGKSTLLLQIAGAVASSSNKKCLYVSGEESSEQIHHRAKRLCVDTSEIYIYPETNVFAIVETVQKYNPDLIIIDSIQTLYFPELNSTPGSLSQVREASARMIYMAKREKIPVFLIGHVTKDGMLAGPMALEHMVDVVIYFEGEFQRNYRIVRATKNRYGSTQEMGIFEMTGHGLIEIPDASQFLLDSRDSKNSGSTVTAVVEGYRPVLLEVQALVTPTTYGIAQRRSTGLDVNRLALLLAILEKRLGLALSKYDVFLNLVGGLKIIEPGIDLAIAASIISSFRNIIVDPQTLFFGELGLSGEVRAVAQFEKRISEAVRLGFKQILMPEQNLRREHDNNFKSTQIIGLKNLYELSDFLK